MFTILNQVQGYDCSLANAEKLKIVQLPSETQRSVTWVEKFYCECSLFAGRWFSLGFALRRISAIDSRDRQRNLETTSPFLRLIARELSMSGVSRGEFFGAIFAIK